MKRFIAGLIVGALLTAGVTVMAESSVVRLIVDGKEISFPDAPPQFIGNRVMVPARPLAEALGGTVTWDAAQRVVVVSKNTPSVATDAMKPRVVTMNAGGAPYATTIVFGEAGDIHLSIRAVSEIASVQVGSDAYLTINGVAFNREDLIVIDGRSYVRTSLLIQRLGWVCSFDGATSVFTIVK